MTANKLDFEERKTALQKQLKTFEVYEKLRAQVMDKIQWEYMTYHEPDDEHNNETWFSAPQPDSWKYEEYIIAMELLEKFDNVLLKK